MNKKIICISIVGLLLLTGISSFSAVGKTLEEKTQEVEIETASSGISVDGFLRIKVNVNTIGEIEEGHYCFVDIKFDDGQKIVMCDDEITSSSKTFKSRFIFVYGFNGYITGREGSVTAYVQIMKPLGGGRYEHITDEMEFEGKYNGPFVSFK